MTVTHIYDAVRTPFGRAAGALSGMRPDDLAAVVMRAAVDRVGLDPARIDDVIFGDAKDHELHRLDHQLAQHGLELKRGRLETLQVNVGRKCNQACRHCHVDAAPWRTEMIDEATAHRIGAWITEHKPAVVFAKDHIIDEPTPRKVAGLLGLDLNIEGGLDVDLLIVGAGPAGVAAAVYALREFAPVEAALD